MQTEQLQGKGLQDYLAQITGLSKTQTVSPELQTEIATQNSVWNAAPDPEEAAKQQEEEFKKYMDPEAATDWWTNPAEQRAKLNTNGLHYDAFGRPNYQYVSPV
jgi:hypothetical protein